MDLKWLGNVVFHLGRIVLQAGYVTEEALGFKREVLHAVGESSVPLGMDIIPRVCSLRVREFACVCIHCSHHTCHLGDR